MERKYCLSSMHRRHPQAAIPQDPSCWNTSTYLLLTFFFAACDRERPIGGALDMPFGAGVLGIDATSVGTKLDRARIKTLEVGDVLKSIADAVLGGGGCGGARVPFDDPLKREPLTLGEAVWARAGGGAGADGCAAPTSAFLFTQRFSSLS